MCFSRILTSDLETLFLYSKKGFEATCENGELDPDFLVFGMKGLQWSPLDHVELFAGKMAVTLAQLEDWGG